MPRSSAERSRSTSASSREEWRRKRVRSGRVQTNGRPSRTAAYVAFLRALGDRGVTSAREFRDDAAAALLPSPWASALTWVGPAIPTLPSLVRRRIVAHVDLLVSRALVIDTELGLAL